MNEAKRVGTDPSWWNDTHSSAWERTKEALRRDWEQTKADVTDGGQELNQDVGDTVKQATGKQAIPPAGGPNPVDSRDSWDDFAPAVRYGYGARQHYGTLGKQDWNDDVERDLRRDWDATGHGGAWDRVKAAVKHGWQNVKRAVT